MLEITLPFIVATFILMFKPGPHMMTFMSLAAGGHWRRMVLFFVGYEVGALILYIVFLQTLSHLPQGFGMLFIFLKGLAAMLFVYMGYTGLKQSVALQKEQGAEAKEKMTSKQVLGAGGTGFMLGLANPYEIVYILTALPALLNKTVYSMSEILIVFAVIVGISLLSTLIYISPIVISRKFMSTTLLDKLRVFSSAAMILIGIYILINLLTQWDLQTAGLLSYLFFDSAYLGCFADVSSCFFTTVFNHFVI